jgi:hypothetical protein
MLIGAHALIYSSQPERLRAFFRDVLRFPNVDAGHGWLIFTLPPAELAVHPVEEEAADAASAGGTELYLMCDDLDATVAELRGLDRAVGLFFFGLLTLFLLGTGYLAPRIGRGSRSCYRWDRALTAVGTIGSLGLIGTGLTGETSLWEGLSFGGLGLAIAVAHARWRGPRDPSRWQVEHLTSLLAAYTVGWSFILALYAGLQKATGLVVPVLGLAAILWARRRFGPAVTDSDPAAAALTVNISADG